MALAVDLEEAGLRPRQQGPPFAAASAPQIGALGSRTALKRSRNLLARPVHVLPDVAALVSTAVLVAALLVSGIFAVAAKRPELASAPTTAAG